MPQVSDSCTICDNVQFAPVPAHPRLLKIAAQIIASITWLSWSDGVCSSIHFHDGGFRRRWKFWRENTNGNARKFRRQQRCGCMRGSHECHSSTHPTGARRGQGSKFNEYDTGSVPKSPGATHRYSVDHRTKRRQLLLFVWRVP